MDFLVDPIVSRQVACGGVGVDLRRVEVDRCLWTEGGVGERLVGHVKDSALVLPHAPNMKEVEDQCLVGTHVPVGVDPPHCCKVQVDLGSGSGSPSGLQAVKALYPGFSNASKHRKGGHKATTHNS